MSRQCFILVVLLLSVENCQSMTGFEHDGHFRSNNSFTWYRDISDGYFALKCVTDNVYCCSDSGNWTDRRGIPEQEGTNGTSCLYVTRGNGVISLYRKSGCTDHIPGLWRCDIPDSSGEIQSLYIYISNRRSLVSHTPSFFAIPYCTGLQDN